MLNFKSIQAADSDGHIDWRLVPDVHCDLALLLVVVLGIAVYQNPLYLTVLTKECFRRQEVGRTVFLWEAYHIKQLGNDDPKVLNHVLELSH